MHLLTHQKFLPQCRRPPLEALPNCIGLDTPDSTSGNEPEAPGEAPQTEAPEIQAAPCEILQVNISTFYTEEILTQVRMSASHRGEGSVYFSAKHTHKQKMNDMTLHPPAVKGT